MKIEKTENGVYAVLNDSMRLDWLLSGNGEITIDVDSSLDLRASRREIDRAMFEDRQEAYESGALVTDYVRKKTDSARLDYILSGNGTFTLNTGRIPPLFGGRRAAIDIAMRRFNNEQERRRLEGNTYFKPCGMMCNPDGTRSIFDDVDQ